MSTLHVRIPTPLKEALDAKATQDRRSLAATVEMILEAALEAEKKAKEK